jgi:PKD repeat protein
MAVFLSALLVVSAVSAGATVPAAADGAGGGATAAAAATAADPILSFTVEPSTVGENGEATVTVDVYNPGDERTFTIEPTDMPDGWSYSDNQFLDGDSFKQVTVGQNKEESVTFTVSGGDQSMSGEVTFTAWRAGGCFWGCPKKEELSKGRTGLTVDASPPVISNVRTKFDGDQVTVLADLQDYGDEVDTAEVTYDTGLSHIGGTTVDMEHQSGTTYAATFTVDPGEDFEYKVTAADTFGNSKTTDTYTTTVPQGSASVTVTNDDDESKDVDIYVDGSKKETVTVEPGGSASTSLTVDPGSHDFEIRYQEQDRNGETFSKTRTVDITQGASNDVSLSVDKRLAPVLAIDCEDCSLGTYSRADPPTVTVHVDNEGGGDLEYEVDTDNFKIVDKKDGKVILQPSTSLEGEFTEKITVSVKNDRHDGEKSKSVTVTGKGTTSVDGKIVGYRSPDESSPYRLGEWYDVKVAVKNTGEVAATFTVSAPSRTGTESKTSTKTIRLGPGETGTVSFQQRWYGTYTQTRSFSHDLLADSDGDGQQETVDEASITLQEPPNGEIKLVPNTGDGEPASIDVTVRNVDTGKTVVDTTIQTDGTDVEARQYGVRKGTYEVIVDADGYRTRTKKVTVEEDTRRVVEPVLAPKGVQAEILSSTFEVDSGAYSVGDEVTATVKVKNTGETTWKFFVGYSVRHQESKTTYSNESQTGTFVTLDPGETKTVTVSWRVDDGAKPGMYDAIAAVWYGYPEDGADRIANTGWATDAFTVTSDSRTETVTYDDTTYTVEYKSDGTIGVYDPSGSLVGEERARTVLWYMSFKKNKVDDPTSGWWEVTDEAGNLEKWYWMAHLNQAGITAFKAYVNSYFGSYKDSIGEFIELSVQATRLMKEQGTLGSTGSWLHNYSKSTQEMHDMYTKQKKVDEYASLMSRAYRIKRTSDDVDTMTDAIRAADDAGDGSTLRGVAIELAMTPLNDVNAALKVTQQQAFVTYQWGKTSKPVLQMIQNLENKSEAGTITRREMKLYFLLQMHFYSSQVKMGKQVAALQRQGEENSHAFDVISDLQGNSPELFRDSAEGARYLVGIKAEQMGRVQDEATNLTERSINTRENPETKTLDRPEPLVVSVPGWTEPGESATITVTSRGEPVIEAKVKVGDNVYTTDRDGNAEVTMWEKGTYRVEVDKDGFEGSGTVLTVREPEVASRTLSSVNLGSVGADEEMTRTSTLKNDGETTLEVESVSAEHDAVEASLERSTAAPGETLAVSVTVDTDELPSGPFQTSVTVEWAKPGGTTEFVVTGNVTSASPDATFTFTPSAPTDGDSVSFDASGSSDPNDDVSSYEWTFGDGTTATGVNPSHTYDAPGEYTVTLEVTDGDGNTDTVTKTVTVGTGQRAPIADAGGDRSAKAGGTVELNASGSSDPDGDALSYTWTQTGGPEVTLQDADTATPTFTAPSVDSKTTLTFEVSVSDGEASRTDTVAVTVYTTVSGNDTADGSDDTTDGAGDDGENDTATGENDTTTEENDTATLSAADVTASAGTNATVTFALENTGSNTSGFLLDVESLPGNLTLVSQSADGGTWKGAETKWLWQSVGPNETVEPSVTIGVPDGANGTYEIRARARTADSQVATTTVTISTDVTVSEAVDQDDDGDIEDTEVLQAIELWRKNETVDGTGGETISDVEILQLIEQWRTADSEE